MWKQLWWEKPRGKITFNSSSVRIFQENIYRELRASIPSFPTCAALLGVQACVIFWTLWSTSVNLEGSPFFSCFSLQLFLSTHLENWTDRFGGCSQDQNCTIGPLIGKKSKMSFRVCRNHLGKDKVQLREASWKDSVWVEPWVKLPLTWGIFTGFHFLAGNTSFRAAISILGGGNT